jgi:uncharacterized protein (TIGR02145 family)
MQLLPKQRELMRMGFALPTVIIVSVVMMLVLVASIGSSAAVRGSLQSQYYEALARSAADAGIAYAQACIESSNSIVQWSNLDPLQPDTDCHGINVPTQASYVLEDTLVRTRFSVDTPVFNEHHATTVITALGTAELLRASTGQSWRVYQQRVSVTLGMIARSSNYYIQTITADTCPTTRTMAVDARDNHTYWVQRLADDRCWMLTNLAYGGGTSNGGTGTYGDVVPIGNGTDGTINGPDNSGTASYVLAKYYIPAGSNQTVYPTEPSTSTDGTGQYGYLYNWCAAMGAQVDTSACMNSETPEPDTSISICPAGWRLPTAGIGGEFTVLNNAVNGGSTTSDAGLRTIWLIQRSGNWSGGFSNLGTTGYYYSSGQYLTEYGRRFNVSATSVGPNSAGYKYEGFAVRCVAV